MPQDEIYFLRGELQDDPMARGYRWSLRVVKIDDTVLAPYLAFRTRELAERVVSNPQTSVIAASELDEHHYFEFSQRKVLFFEQEATCGALPESPRKPYLSLPRLFTHLLA